MADAVELLVSIVPMIRCAAKVLMTGLLGVAALPGCSDDSDDAANLGGGAGAGTGGASSTGGAPSAGGNGSGGDSASGGSTSVEGIPAEGTYELTAYRTGDCDSLEDQELPFKYMVMSYKDSSESFWIETCESLDTCSTDAELTDSFNMTPEGASTLSPRGLASAQSYNQNSETCDLMVVEEHVLEPTDDGYLWRLSDYRGKVSFDDKSAFSCNFSDEELDQNLDALDECPSIDEWEGTRVQ